MARRDVMASSSISMSFNKDRVIKILRTNRAEHEKIYLESVEGYRGALSDALVDMECSITRKRKELGEKDLPKPRLDKSPFVNLSVPNNSLKEYDTVLEMLSLTPDETIELDQDHYNCYMKDNWYWMKDFLISNSAYRTLASDKLSSM